ncbi:MAG: sulfatase-like hydrolase/transferase [Verrucomicrobiota bacterium]
MLLASSSWLLAAPKAPPNIIFFLVDDYDKPETSTYGGSVLTPNLDRLAKEGMTFHNAHVTSTVCTPSRYTCLTGRYAGSSTHHGYFELFPKGTQALPAFNVALEPDNMNVGAVLADNGYATGYVGKYHLSGEESATSGTVHPIEKNAPYSEEIDRLFFENEKTYRNLIKERGFTWAKNIYWGNLKAPFKGHNPEWTIDAAIEFIDKHHDQPFYLHYCTTLLHGPNGEWHRSLTERELVTGEGMLKEPLEVMPPRNSVLRRIRKAGLTENEVGYLWMDDSLGLILDKLDELGIADNTIVLFLADHGSEKKGSLFKSRGTEVPCLMRWPAKIPAGVECHELIQNTDFAPTWFEVAGATVPAEYQIDGVSLSPLFENPSTPVRDFVYGEMGAARSIKTKDFNYIALRYTTDQIEAVKKEERRILKTLQGLSGGVSRAVRHHPDALDPDQLYHLTNDPNEQSNVADNPEFESKLAELKTILENELARFPHRPFGEFIPGGNAASPSDSKIVREKLREAALNQ